MTAPISRSLADRTLGEIAATLPGATAVFRNFKLDFCCGGEIALAEAAQRRGIDAAAVERALTTLDAGPMTAPDATDDMLDHILARFHDTHRRELPELVRLARKVEAVHAAHSQAPVGLADALETLISELEEHMRKEELILFPMMRQGGNPMIRHPIAKMRGEHVDHGEAMRRLDEITNGFALPADACRSWQALYAGAAKLVDDLMEHIHLENNVLFPRFEQEAACS